ncbi:MAG TPA: GNAT family N-acetyltransferase [Bryobacteraceae bacterium]|nr:GNAT family N-acetyltransferase [Bryobacteraceae bacterium]
MRPAPGAEFEIEKLRREHEVSSFNCGNPVLTIWLQKFAWNNQQAGSAKIYVALANDRVVGYYALTAGSVQKHESPERIAKGLANHPIGVVLLARLAVDNRYQGQGLGKALLFDALMRIAEAAEIVGTHRTRQRPASGQKHGRRVPLCAYCRGVRAVLVHTIDEDARGFMSTSTSTLHG